MQNNNVGKSVSSKYLEYRNNVLNYSYTDMRLKIQNDKQVYIAVFDISLNSTIIGFETQTLAFVFGLNAHVYHGSGSAIVDLEKNAGVMKAMQSLFISCPQVLDVMQLSSNTEYYESKNVRAYLKTSKGIYFKELDNTCKKDNFLNMLMNNVLIEITKVSDKISL